MTNTHSIDNSFTKADKDARQESTGSRVDMDQIELRSDGDARFRAAVHAAAKSGPKHRPAKR